MSYSTYSDVTNKTNITFNGTSNPSDTQVAGYISEADAWIDSYAGHNWLSNTVTQELYDSNAYGPRSGLILLRSPGPVLSITEVDYYSQGNWVQVMQGQPYDYPTQPTFYAYLPEGKILFNTLRLSGHQNVRVTYTYGYNTVPTTINELSSTLAAIKVYRYLSGNTVKGFSLGDLHEDYPEDGPYTVVLKELKERVAELKFQITTRRLMASSG